MSDAKGPPIAVYPPTVSLIAPAAAIMLGWFVPFEFLPPFGAPFILVPGLVFLGLAGWIAFSGMRAFLDAGTNVDPRQPALRLVTTGPYRYSRNPMYLGMVLLQLGLAYTFSLDWAVVGAIAVWAILHFGVVLREEAYLTETFGEDYTAYKARTRRWI